MDEEVSAGSSSVLYDKRSGRGNWDGLATAYSIVKNHGGLIQVESDVGKGATFKVYLPAVDVPARRARKRFARSLSEVRGVSPEG